MRAARIIAVAALATTAVVIPAGTASAKPDTACMRAGIATLKGAHDFLLQGLRPVGLSMCER